MHCLALHSVGNILLLNCGVARRLLIVVESYAVYFSDNLAAKFIRWVILKVMLY